MKSKIGSKKKVLIAAILAGVLMIGAIVSVVLVLAAQTQNITSNITISYSVDGVGARVSAKYGTVPTTGSVTMTSMTTSDGTATELNFNANDATTTESLTPNGDITLSQATGTEVVFEYIFENTADTSFTVDLTSTGDAVNIKESYYISKTALSASEYGRISLESSSKQVVASDVEENTKLYYYVKVSVDNINRNASYDKAYEWKLEQIKAEEMIVALDNTTNGGTGGISTVTAYKNLSVPVLESLPTAPSGMGFAGYYSDATAGDMYINAKGVGVKEITEAITLYARYSENAVIDVENGIMYGISPTANATITEVVVQATVTEIAEGAFENNTDITRVTIGGETAAATGYATGSALKKIGARAFSGCTSLEEVTFAERISLKSIGAEAFKGCSSLTELIIPEGVTSIEAGALQNLTNVTRIVLPTTLESVPNAIFKDCNKLITLECNADIIKEGKDQQYYYLEDWTTEYYPGYSGLDLLFGDVKGFTDADYQWITYTDGSAPDSIDALVFNSGKNFKSYFVYDEQITSMTIPTTLIQVSYYAFSEFDISKILFEDFNSFLKFQKFDKKLYGLNDTYYGGYDGHYGPDVLIGEIELKGHIDLSLILTDESITEIPEFAFDSLPITSIDIPSHITKIGKNAFSSTAIESLIIPGNVEEIGESAFSDIYTLKSVELNEGVKRINNGAFNVWGPYDILLKIPTSIEYIGSNQLVSWSEYNNCHKIYIKDLNKYLSIDFRGWGADFDLYLNGEKLTVLDFTNYNEFKFYDHFSSMRNDNLKIICDSNFIPEGSDDYEDESYDWYSGYSGLSHFGFSYAVQEVEFVSGTSISNYAFYNSEVNIVRVSSSIKSVGHKAFSAYNLKNIYYSGTKTEWNAITGLANAGIKSGCVVHCVDGDITY